MKDCMLTMHLGTNESARDVQVNGAPDLRAAIAHAEMILSPLRVDHGRGIVLELWRPALILEYGSDVVYREHDQPAETSMQVVTPKRGWDK